MGIDFYTASILRNMVLLQSTSMKTSKSEGDTLDPIPENVPDVITQKPRYLPGYNDVGSGQCEKCVKGKCTAKFIHIPGKVLFSLYSSCNE